MRLRTAPLLEPKRSSRHFLDSEIGRSAEDNRSQIN